MKDTIEGSAARLPGFLRNWVRRQNWEEKVRDLSHDAPVHSTVADRFKLDLWSRRPLPDHIDQKLLRVTTTSRAITLLGRKAATLAGGTGLFRSTK